MAAARPEERRMTPKPVNVAAAAIARQADRHRMGLKPPAIWLLAGAAAEALAPRVKPQPVQVPSGTEPTPAELTVLKLVANGATSASMARMTHRTPSLVNQQLQRVCERLGAVTWTQAVAICMARGWITDADVRLPVGKPRGKAGPKAVAS